MESHRTRPPLQEPSPRLDKVVVVGGLGEVGRLFARSLAASGIAVHVIDRQPPREEAAADRFLQADVTHLDEAARGWIADADGVVVCLPEGVALAALGQLTGAMRRGALWVDTLSVKSEICHSLLARARDVEVLSLNPMFAPGLGWRGNAVAAVELAAGRKSAAMLGLLESWGARVERLGAAEHDGLTAAIQVATHAAVLAFGSALLELGYEVGSGLRLATPPHRLMLALLSRIANANPTVYAEIQRHHPRGEVVRQSMVRALEALSETDTLDRRFEELKQLLSPEQSALRDWSDRAMALATNAAGDVEP